MFNFRLEFLFMTLNITFPAPPFSMPTANSRLPGTTLTKWVLFCTT